jgi:hypothetical protein
MSLESKPRIDRGAEKKMLYEYEIHHTNSRVVTVNIGRTKHVIQSLSSQSQRF